MPISMERYAGNPTPLFLSSDLLRLVVPVQIMI
jgi:hypothetical protein